jgi:hypothetical protein
MFAILAAVMVAVGIYTVNTGVVMGEFLDRAWPGLVRIAQKALSTHAPDWMLDALFVSLLSLAVWRFAFLLAFVFAVLAVISQLRRGTVIARLR